ncbi:hypothetical protein [Methylorubrum aminovorans]|uniref:hypothetical protein n=1 Tax=Methylorubrum aminovorans TaxID=269069 RepID=UPI0024E09792|nr:hypothetical protein [Methylorubrum aminovorans]
MPVEPAGDEPFGFRLRRLLRGWAGQAELDELAAQAGEAEQALGGAEGRVIDGEGAAGEPGARLPGTRTGPRSSLPR